MKYDIIICSGQYWNSANIRNGELSFECTNGSNNRALVFGEGINNLPYDRYIASHSVLTNIIDLNGNGLHSSPNSNCLFSNCSSVCYRSSVFTEELPTTTFSTTRESTVSLIANDDVQNIERETVVSC